MRIDEDMLARKLLTSPRLWAVGDVVTVLHREGAWRVVAIDSRYIVQHIETKERLAIDENHLAAAPSDPVPLSRPTRFQILNAEVFGQIAKPNCIFFPISPSTNFLWSFIC